MTNAELIKELRYCAEHDGCDYYIAKDCPREYTWVCGADCEQRLMHAAADALEAANAEIVKLNTKCADLQSQINEMENEIEELLPKEGEWIDANGPLTDDGDTTESCRCSVCGDWLTASDEYWTRGRYCPNCGARMRGEHDEQ